MVRTIDTKGSLNFALPLDKDFSLFLCGWIVFVFETWFWQKKKSNIRSFQSIVQIKIISKFEVFIVLKLEESLDFAEQIHTTKKHINHKRQTSRFNLLALSNFLTFWTSKFNWITKFRKWASTLIFAYSTCAWPFLSYLTRIALDYFNNRMVYDIENIDI